jgi:hypothetical protein
MKYNAKDPREHTPEQYDINKKIFYLFSNVKAKIWTNNDYLQPKPHRPKEMFLLSI